MEGTIRLVALKKQARFILTGGVPAFGGSRGPAAGQPDSRFNINT